MEIADPELELVKWADEEAVCYVCMHPKQAGREMGVDFSENEAGVDCPLFEPGTKVKISGDLERLLAAAEKRQTQERDRD